MLKVIIEELKHQGIKGHCKPLKGIKALKNIIKLQRALSKALKDLMTNHRHQRIGASECNYSIADCSDHQAFTKGRSLASDHAFTKV